MTSDEITIDVGFASNAKSLHEMFAAVLGFPGYYGMNWNAFWDCVASDDQSTMPRHLVLKGLSRLEEKLPEDARHLRRIFEDLKTDRPECKVTLHEE